jgi:hypothetical protein
MIRSSGGENILDEKPARALLLPAKKWRESSRGFPPYIIDPKSSVFGRS